MKDLSILENNQFSNGYAYSIYFIRDLESFPLHWHQYIEIVYSLQEGLIYEVNGEIINMEKGDVLFIWPGELHSIIFQPNTSSTLMLQFDSQLLTDRIDFNKIIYLFYKTRILREKENDVLLTKMHSILFKILKISLNEKSFPEIKSCILIYKFIICLGEKLRGELFKDEKKLSKQRTSVERQMFFVCSYITNHCKENISLEQAAYIAGFSKYHFSRLFKEYTGHSFPEFQVKGRLRIAEALLMDSDISITEVSIESGFKSISTFNRVFLHFKKVSPTKFRKMYLFSEVEKGET